MLFAASQRLGSMKRKIAAIFAADVVGYSRMIAEDEEDTLQCLADYREVMDDFIAKGSGRIFNTAGDSVFAEFSSSVEAVRCAIDIQESLRSRNLQRPTNRQMLFRIGITLGDIVERDGDLLGDGVNIAARLEGIADPGGICVSRTVYEQVQNKIAVQFSDIGEQQVKNIPQPVHAYAVGSKISGPRPSPIPVHKAAETKPAGTGTQRWVMAALGAVAVVAVVVAAYLFGNRVGQPTVTATPSAPAVASAPVAAPAALAAKPLVPETIPFIADRLREQIRNEYLPAAGPKALAVGSLTIGFVVAQPDAETAKAAALKFCQARADEIKPPPRRCELYAVGDEVVSATPPPALPPAPWLLRDPSIETPFSVADMPLITDEQKARIAQNYAPMGKSKAIALHSSGNYANYWGQRNQDEAVRRALEFCGIGHAIPCMIVTVDDVFVVPLPKSMKPAGLLSPETIPAVAPDLRNEIVRRLRNAQGGWSALAAGEAGRPGVAVRAASEEAAVAGALSDCSRHDRNCRVIGIGPFAVKSN